MRLAVNQEMCRFESCPQSQHRVPAGRPAPQAALYAVAADCCLDPGSTPGAGPSRGCRLATALLLQRRSVEFDPLPRHQFGTYAESERHLTFNQDQVGSIPTGSTKKCRKKEKSAMEIIDHIPVWGAPVDEAALK